MSTLGWYEAGNAQRVFPEVTKITDEMSSVLTIYSLFDRFRAFSFWN